MAKIIDINKDVISIGMDDGGIKEVRSVDINFVPHIGDEVEIFETETKTIVSKVENKSTDILNGGIHINLDNSANNVVSQQYIPPQFVAPQFVENRTKAVNKIIYCVLAFFLGWMGAHKFYAGKIVTGVLFLLFSWTFVPGFIAFIDFIIGLTKNADPNGMILV